MRPSTLVLTIGLLTAPVALLANPSMTDGLQELAQNTIPQSAIVPDQTIHGRPLEPAPVPGPLPGIPPVERAGGPGSRDLVAGPVNSLPFSAAPTSNMQAGSPASPNGRPGDVATPSLGR